MLQWLARFSSRLVSMKTPKKWKIFCETHGFTLRNPWFYLLIPLVSQGKTMGFTTRFLDFCVAKMLKFTSDNANKHSLTSLLRILNDLEMLKHLRILTYKECFVGIIIMINSSITIVSSFFLIPCSASAEHVSFLPRHTWPRSVLAASRGARVGGCR